MTVWAIGETLKAKKTDPVLAAVILNLQLMDFSNPEKPDIPYLFKSPLNVFDPSSAEFAWNDYSKQCHYSAEDLTAIDIPINVSLVNSLEEFSTVRQAIHSFLTKQGLQLLPINKRDEWRVFEETRDRQRDIEIRVQKAIVTQSYPAITFHLNPTQKISELGPNGESVKNALVALSTAAKQAREASTPSLP